jgi:hypothetical protein
MAQQGLVVNDLLCFAVYYFKKQPIKPVKAMIVDFYAPAIVTVAKELLIDNVSALNIDNWPRPVSRRTSDNRLKNEVDDIFSVLTYLDEKGFLVNLPRYVSDNPEQLPLLRLEKGDLTVIMNKIDRLKLSLDSIKTDLKENRCAITKLSDSKVRFNVTPLRPVNVGHSIDSSGGHAWPTLGAKSLTKQTCVNSASASWADQSEHGEPAVSVRDNDGFETVYNNRHYKSNKRLRAGDSPLGAASQGDKSGGGNKRSNVVRLIGSSTVNCRDLKAAPPKPKKSVFCVSNVDKSIDDKMLSNFLLKEMNINIVSIYPTKLSKTRNLDRWSGAFRLCILEKDRDKLLDSSRLPAGIAIREWFFKGQTAAPATLHASSLQVTSLLHGAPSADQQQIHAELMHVNTNDDNENAMSGKTGADLHIDAEGMLLSDPSNLHC